MWWVNLQREYGSEELYTFDWSALQKELLYRFKAYPKPIDELISRTRDPLRFNIYDVQSLPLWHKGRIALIGVSRAAAPADSSREEAVGCGVIGARCGRFGIGARGRDSSKSAVWVAAPAVRSVQAAPAGFAAGWPRVVRGLVLCS